MASYLITYDLITPGQNYTELHEAIKKLGTWWHCLESTWIVKNNGPTADIRDAIKAYLDANDKLLVLKLTGDGAWTGFDQQCSDWLRNNL